MFLSEEFYILKNETTKEKGNKLYVLYTSKKSKLSSTESANNS